jgi:polar amino acid transport system ATP-binding protein
MTLVHIEGLRVRFGRTEVLHGIDVDVAAEEVVGVIGPSGCGKTTLLRCVNQLERPSAGRIVVDGHVLADGGRQASRRELRTARADIGMVFQRFNLFPNLTVLDNITEAPRYVRDLPRAEAEERAMDLLARVGLPDKAAAYPAQLSGGQQQRVAIARALAMEPKLMLFDEVTSAVDPEMAGEILDVMRGLARSGMTMIVVTHEIAFAAEVADRILFMEHGRIAESGPADELLRRPRHARTRAFLAAVLDRVPMEPDAQGAADVG